MCLGAQGGAQQHRIFGHDKAMFYEDSGYWDEAWEAQQQGCTDDSPEALLATAEAWAERRVAGLDNKLMWQLHLAEQRTPPETGQPKSQQHRNQQRIAAAARRVAAAEDKAARAVMMEERLRTQLHAESFAKDCLHQKAMLLQRQLEEEQAARATAKKADNERHLEQQVASWKYGEERAEQEWAKVMAGAIEHTLSMERTAAEVKRSHDAEVAALEEELAHAAEEGAQLQQRAKESAAAQAEAAARAELAKARVQSLLSHAAKLEAQHAAALAETRSEIEAVERRLQGELAAATASAEAAHAQLQQHLWLTEQERMQAQAALQAAATKLAQGQVLQEEAAHEVAQAQALQRQAAHELAQARASLAQGKADIEELRAQRACPELPQGVLSEHGVKLGEGGYGTVDKHTVTVAVKQAHDAVSEACLCREARSMLKCAHPRIMALLAHTQVEVDGHLRYAILMEVAAGDLSKRIRKLSLLDALTVAHDAATGIAHMHSQGLAHKDIKAGNLLVFPQLVTGPGGTMQERLRVKVADLGLSRKLKQRPTAADMCTPLHNHPRTRFDRHSCGSRDDVWGLAIVLHDSLSATRFHDLLEAAAVERLKQAQHRIDLQAFLEQNKVDKKVKEYKLMNTEERITATEAALAAGMIGVPALQPREGLAVPPQVTELLADVFDPARWQDPVPVQRFLDVLEPLIEELAPPQPAAEPEPALQQDAAAELEGAQEQDAAAPEASKVVSTIPMTTYGDISSMGSVSSSSQESTAVSGDEALTAQAVTAEVSGTSSMGSCMGAASTQQAPAAEAIQWAPQQLAEEMVGGTAAGAASSGGSCATMAELAMLSPAPGLGDVEMADRLNGLEDMLMQDVVAWAMNT